MLLEILSQKRRGRGEREEGRGTKGVRGEGRGREGMQIRALGVYN